ncbi:MAG TPA: lytic transglycosylase, partial [Hyphomonas sp.]|nr:lytic transglycosylase [Hyphomonas sp.]
MWIRASRGVPGMNFSEVSFALDKLQDWPKKTSMRRRAEEIIGESSFSHKERIDWLTESGPITGAGKIALADSWRAIGEPGKALEAVRDAWHNNSLERDVEREVLSTYGKQLTQDDHRARVEFLLWTNQRTAASKLKYLLTSDYRKLVDARIALAARSRNVDALVDAVPANLQDNPGLLYERAKWRRQKLRNQDVATPLLTGIDGNDIPEAGRSRLWDERNIAIRTDLKDGNWSRAYQLASPHGMESGGDFAEAEWVSGWIALRLKNDADRSLQHFETMSDGVSTPISLARGKYWAGRARDALGQPDAARTDYTAAAEHKFTYYGQLAAERLDDKKLAFPKTSEPTAEEISAFEDKPMVQALRLLGESGEERLFREFAYHMDDLLETESEYLLLARIATEYQVPDVGVRGAKAGLAKGIVSTDAAYPVVAYPLLREPQVERPLMLALSRQESEMNP